MQKIYRLTIMLFGLWLIVWAIISWPSIQDDALIHLRYANNLLHLHMVSYNGLHRTYGASSLLYITLLAALRSIFTSPELPRAVSTICHFLLFGGLAWAFARRLKGAQRTAWWLAILTLGCLVAPSAVRWLQDGMETSLELCLVALLAFLVVPAATSNDERPPFSFARLAALFLLGFLGVLLRVELLLLMGFAALFIFIMRWQVSEETPGKSLLAALPPLAGALVGAATIVLLMHHLLPDTAVAKMTSGSWRGPVGNLIPVFGGAPCVGIGLLLVEAISLAAILITRPRLRLAAIVANLLFPLSLALAIVRGQQIQGIRYLLWMMLFPAIINILLLARTPAEAASTTQQADPLWLRRSLFGLSVVLALFCVVEIPLFLHLFSVRRATFAAFRSEHLDRLHSLNVVAADIGYIGWFTGAKVCDVDGLVNGREIAHLTEIQRVERCASMNPQVVFMTHGQFGFLWQLPNLWQWSVCGRYDFGNVHHVDLHYLLAAPSVTKEVCSAAGATPQPLETIFPKPPGTAAR